MKKVFNFLLSKDIAKNVEYMIFANNLPQLFFYRSFFRQHFQLTLQIGKIFMSNFHRFCLSFTPLIQYDNLLAYHILSRHINLLWQITREIIVHFLSNLIYRTLILLNLENLWLLYCLLYNFLSSFFIFHQTFPSDKVLN
jgi:hypothetical protein